MYQFTLLPVVYEGVRFFIPFHYWVLDLFIFRKFMIKKEHLLGIWVAQLVG